ncbi:TPA: hypothetical protein DCZ46_03595 [Candidatus Campbellbacteria bacterium]|nr:MAG: hypothetical protein UR58_C0001G0691 [Candidatus Campbellbacteria bacterium GW2011_OD1_34_28]KKP74785.1 MAG: hypothetical protein UR74_C0002G0051 [Candidatus Campbellbacteria bacterium GW2011_GWD2_35_24]KKP75671.1 MAG: hypothetical protein UR75_C0002G0052 [Candidatus Campbellbacteria bacterium GW2011_GWC2_35_28]KKP77081.1 MAG: hypothetical protein UR76_C0002G0282 [Candidatus Campbellbacteria bacterium GW2011_GWC1_35_31]KKP79007.1 MAG: hypothetical protein UR79_C0002G0282 [Candidatus Cam
MKLQKILSLALALAFVFAFAFLSVAGTISAADLRIGAKNNGSVNVGAEEQIKNLYIAGNIVTIDANIEKGIHSAGNVININGNVGQSVYSAGGTIMINGNVNGSVHTAGGSVVVGGDIVDDLFIAGGNLMISKEASVGGDLIVGGGTVDIQSPVAGNVYLGGGMITINSEIKGNVKVGQADELVLGSNAVINGNLEYYSKKPIQLMEGAVVKGQTIISESKFGREKEINKGVFVGAVFAFLSIALFVKMIGLMIVAFVLVYMFKKFTETVTKESFNNFWKSLGIGFVVLVLTPIAFILLMITLFGLWLGALVLMAYLISLTLSASIAGIIFGTWLARLVMKKKDYSVDWKIVVGGTILLSIIGLIPLFGWIAMFVLVLLGLGAFWRIIYSSYK